MRTNKTSIKGWAADDRPREKLLQNGVTTLSDAELIAILIGSGNREESAVGLSRRILNSAQNNLNELAKMSVADLCRNFKGIGDAKAITICAALELGKRRKVSEVLERKKVISSQDAFYLFEAALIDLPHEEFWVAVLNTANKVIEKRRLTQGGLRQTVVDVPILLRYALEKSATSVIVAHNHPSGEIKASNEDNRITQNIKDGCEAIGIRLLDHIIVGSGGNYFSYADEGVL